ncbi:uncharacterized protein METZ01_LOCUS275225, partial [marine metagenome]
MNMTLSRLTFNKLIVPISLIILIASSAIAQDTKVTLLSPLDGATGVHDPFTGTWNDILENEDMQWPIASDNPQARAIVHWNPVDNAQEYEISLMLMSARWDYIAPVWESDMTNKTSYSFGYPATQWCCQDASDQMQWKVRAIINGEPQEWSDTWIFTFQDFIYPNKKDEEMLKAGWNKPTVWDSVIWVVSEEFENGTYLSATKDVYKAWGEIVGHYPMYILVYGDDDSKNGPVWEVDCALRKTGQYADACPENPGVGDYAKMGFYGNVK